jgi:pyruvate/2-oxoglutarate dehydrogenase complex dihydrolipoamide acyltransferase (E2) component
MAMRKGLSVLGAAVLLCGGGAFADDHLVSPDAAAAQLRAAAVTRRADLSAVEKALSTPEARRASAALGVDIRQVKGAAGALTDSELRDLAVRASVLDADPAAGLSHDVDQLLVVFLIVAIVILVIKAV